MLCDKQVFQHGQTREQTNVLERTCNAGILRNLEIGQAFQKELFARIPVHGQHTACWLVEAGDAVKDRRLARTVRTDDGCDVAALHIEAQIIDRDETTKAHRQMLNCKNGVFRTIASHNFCLRHQPCPSLVKAPDTNFF